MNGDRILSREEFLAGLSGQDDGLDRSPVLSAEEFIAGIQDVTPGKPGALRSLATGAVEGAAAGMDMLDALAQNALGADEALKVKTNSDAYYLDLPPRPEAGPNIFTDAASALRQTAAGLTPPEQVGRGNMFTEGLPKLGGQVLPGVALGAANPAAGAIYFGSQAGPTYFEILSEGGSPDQAMMGMIGNAGLMQLERLGVGGALTRALKRVGATKLGEATLGKIGAYVAAGGAKEVGTEALEQFGHDLILTGMTKAEVDILDNVLATVATPELWVFGGMGAGAELATRRGPQASPAAPGARPPTPMAAQRPTEPIAPQGQPGAPAAQPAPVPTAGPALPPAEVPMLGDGGERGLVSAPLQIGPGGQPQVVEQQALTAEPEPAKNAYVEPAGIEQAMSGQTPEPAPAPAPEPTPAKSAGPAKKIPKILYRGRSRGGGPLRGEVSYFTSSKDAARRYADPYGDGESPEVMEAELDLKNPASEEDIRQVGESIGWEFVTEDPAAHLNDKDHKPLVDALRAAGFDGAIGGDNAPDDSGRITSYVVFSREQVRPVAAPAEQPAPSAEVPEGELETSRFHRQLLSARSSPARLENLGYTVEEVDFLTSRMRNGASKKDALYSLEKQRKTQKPPAQESAKFTPPETAPEVNPRARGAEAPPPEAPAKPKGKGSAAAYQKAATELSRHEERIVQPAKDRLFKLEKEMSIFRASKKGDRKQFFDVYGFSSMKDAEAREAQIQSEIDATKADLVTATKRSDELRAKRDQADADWRAAEPVKQPKVVPSPDDGPQAKSPQQEWDDDLADAKEIANGDDPEWASPRAREWGEKLAKFFDEGKSEGAWKRTLPKRPKSNGGATEMFAGGPNPFGKSSNVSVEGLKRWATKWLTSAGDKPRGVRREMELAEGSSKAEMIEVRRHARRLDAAMRKSDANWRATESADLVDAAFEGDKAAIEALPDEAQAAVADMRAHLDRLIRSQVKAGGVIDPEKMPEFAKKILESQGSYARRSYRAYLDPDWADKVPADVRQRTHDLFRSWEEYAGATDAEIDAELDAILQKAKESTDNPWKAIAAGKLGRKDLSLYKRRKDIPSELRAFLGEVEDPIANYATSVFKIAQNVARHEAAVNIKKAGLGKFLFEKPTGDATAKLTAEGNRALAPLDGLYVTPELKEALTAISPKDMALWMKVASRLNGAIKWGKVIGQPWAFMRNLWGNVPMSIANGHLPAYFKSAEWKAAFGEGDLDTLKRLKRLGIIDDNISTYEWEDAKRAATATPEELAKGALDPGPVGKVQRFAERAFQAADNAPKIRFFLAEEAALKEAGYSAKEAEAIASDRTRDLMPTPERMPEILRQFRKQPYFGSFFAFRAEVIRTTANRIKLISEELKSKNPKVQAMGRRRAAGQIAAATITPTLAYGLNMMLGTDAEDDEAKRNFLPPWDKNSRVLWLGDDLKGEYFDFSDLDPFTMGSDPALRILAGGDPKDTIEGFVREELQSFVGPSPLTQLALDTLPPLFTDRAPVDRDGKPIDDMTAHILKQVQPGFVASARRVPETGLAGEVGAAFTGIRRYQFDVPKSLEFDARDYERLTREAEKKRGRQASKDPEGDKAYLGEMEVSRKKAFDEMAAKAQAATRLGMSTDEVRKILRDILSAREVNAIIGGTYVPHRDTRKLK